MTKILLLFIFVVASILGVAVFFVSDGAIHEIEGLILILIAVVALSGSPRRSDA
jgi:hypothetical protein